ncbi:hypothetical protein K3495_g4473 [Podosphaera aphanis]|nr:hypothetical protein K3495_g4473 [Podosphaera aphanis]
MRLPGGFEGSGYVRVNKALFGLKQSGKAWYEKLNTKLISLGFERSTSDHYVYIHPSKQCIIGAYVDDLVVCGVGVENVKTLKDRLSDFFHIKDLGLIDTILGWKVTRDRTTRTLKISQSHYINNKIKSFGLNNAKPYTSPLEGYNGILLALEGEPLADESAYSSAVGSVGYASNSTRPDITFATSQLGRHNSSPVERH